VGLKSPISKAELMMFLFGGNDNYRYKTDLLETFTIKNFGYGWITVYQKKDKELGKVYFIHNTKMYTSKMYMYRPVFLVSVDNEKFVIGYLNTTYTITDDGRLFLDDTLIEQLEVVEWK
jgi:hypothetical protein